MKYFSSILTLLLLFSCSKKGNDRSSSQSNQDEAQISSELTEIEDAFHFFTLGDWGRNGHYHQKDMADMMDKACKN